MPVCLTTVGTGCHDPFASREAFPAGLRDYPVPVWAIYGADTPCKSKAGMAALKSVDGIELIELKVGKLSVHEENPNQVAQAIGI